ncbi:hydantoinase/oxoprolinase N-terminal domain-containing protein [Bdellovibrio bacteriovorus]|uniref:hydantoinase/oxoprolinase N-terminal domain-containing protein n=1 Tax=Bdellovibrio bacteriovorus TaxID=959 RepID=UPI0035A65165
MQNRFLLGVSVGESFAEYSFLSGSEPISQKRVYLSRENLKQSLQQFVSQHADKKLEHVFVSLRLPKKLLSFQLSGAVAHVTTEGFEHWLSLSGNTTFPLTNKDLLFAVRERTLADGTVEIPVETADLEAIAAKLQMMDCKKVCLHFLHSSTQPENVLKAQQVLNEKGLEVFIPEKTDNPDEVSRWNKNALNATVSSVFSERKAEILSALEGVAKENIHFIDSQGQLFQEEPSRQIGSLFSASTSLGLALANKKKADVLYLGLENFWLISGDQWETKWNSSWGSVEMPHLRVQELGIQPTLGISLNDFHRFDFSKQQEGWEPGPMLLGRGQKLTLLDLWSENTKLTKLHGLEDRFSAQGIQRFKNALLALSKVSQSRNTDINHVTKELQSLAFQRLAMEAALHRRKEKMFVTGPLVSVFANAFKKDPHSIIDTNEFSESQAVALCGWTALQENA